MINKNQFKKPSIEELKNQFITTFYANAPNTESRTSVSIVSILAYSVAGLVYLLWGLVERETKNLFVSTSEGSRLDDWAKIVNLKRNPAAKAMGQVRFTGVNGIVVPKGSPLQSASGWMFLTDAEATIDGGEALVSVTAEKEGVLGNVPKDEALTLIISLAGVDKTAPVVSANGLSGGREVESDAEYRKRIDSEFKVRSIGGSASDYRRWAKQSKGFKESTDKEENADKLFLVNRYAYNHGIGILILREGKPLDVVNCDHVQNYLDGEEPGKDGSLFLGKAFTDEVFVIGSTKNKKIKGLEMTTVNLRVEISGLTATKDESIDAVKEQVKKNLKNYFVAKSYPYIDFTTNFVDEAGVWGADGKRPYSTNAINKVITDTLGVGSRFNKMELKKTDGGKVPSTFTAKDLLNPASPRFAVVMVDDKDINFV